jgi:hypothetical protein
MKIASGSKLLPVLAAAAMLSGCYVVPLQAVPAPGGPDVVVAPPPPPQPLTFTARLYPANELAGSYGIVGAVVTNDLNGRGRFSAAIGGESFSGESTRVAGSARDGIANGSGSRGSYIDCRYTMNSPVLGMGTCRLSNGAVFTMHIGG